MMEKETELNYLSLSAICLFARVTPTSRNFVEGEKLINSRPCAMIYVGKTSEDEESVTLIGFCLRTENSLRTPYEIETVIKKNGKVQSSWCTCVSGTNEKRCKHIIAMLVYCSRNDLGKITLTPSIDKKLIWGTLNADSLEDYVAAPLDQHKCFQDENKKRKKLRCKISEEQGELIKKLLCTGTVGFIETYVPT